MQGSQNPQLPAAFVSNLERSVKSCSTLAEKHATVAHSAWLATFSRVCILDFQGFQQVEFSENRSNIARPDRGPPASARGTPMTRILIADDHDVVRAGLRAILQSQAGWEVVAEASDGKEAVELALATRPDVAVLDFGLPTLNGVEATRQIRSKLPRVEILIFTMHDTDALVRDVLEAGARGFLLKSDASRFLISAVETLADHKPFFTGKVSEALLESFLLKKPSEGALTGREKSVIQLIAEGRPNRKIAEVLSISIKSVEMHRASALKKLNADSTAALIRYAIKNKLVEG